MDFEGERLRQVEQMLRHYLAQPKSAFIKRMERGLLDEVFAGFQVKTERGVLIRRRANRLAADLAACMAVYVRVRLDERRRKTQLPVTVGAAKTLIEDLVVSLDQRKKLRELTGQMHQGNSLPSLTALQLLLVTMARRIVERDANLDRLGRLGRRMVEGILERSIVAVIDDARRELLLGGRRAVIDRPTHVRVINALRVRAKSTISEESADWASSDYDAVDRVVSSMAEAMLLIFSGEDPDAELLKTSIALRDEIAAANTGQRAEPLAPGADEALLWSLALLVDGWQPRAQAGPNSGKPMRLTSARTGIVPTLADHLLTKAGCWRMNTGGDKQDRPFSGVVRRLAKRFPEIPIGGPFAGRRRTGIERGEWRPDEHDRLDQADVELLRRHGVPVPEKAVQVVTVVNRFSNWPT